MAIQTVECMREIIKALTKHINRSELAWSRGEPHLCLVNIVFGKKDAACGHSESVHRKPIFRLLQKMLIKKPLCFALVIKFEAKLLQHRLVDNIYITYGYVTNLQWTTNRFTPMTRMWDPWLFETSLSSCLLLPKVWGTDRCLHNNMESWTWGKSNPAKAGDDFYYETADWPVINPMIYVYKSNFRREKQG